MNRLLATRDNATRRGKRGDGGQSARGCRSPATKRHWSEAGVGAVLGGVAGNAISSGHGAGTVLGALAGGLGGAVIEQQVTRQ